MVNGEYPVSHKNLEDLAEKVDWLHQDIKELRKDLKGIMWKVIGTGASVGAISSFITFLIIKGGI